MKRVNRKTSRGSILDSWTISRATGTGVVSALAALILWLAFPAWPKALLYPFAAALALTVVCGLSILWITVRDVTAGPKRGKMLRAIRGFDVAAGILLAAPALYALRSLAPELGL